MRYKNSVIFFNCIYITPNLHNLAAHFSKELVDYAVYVIDVSAGDKVPRKGGPGTTQSDLLVINKTDLAIHVGADLAVMDPHAQAGLLDHGTTQLEGAPQTRDRTGQLNHRRRTVDDENPS